MKTFLTKEEINERLLAMDKAFRRSAFTKDDIKAAAEAISKAFVKLKERERRCRQTTQ